MSVLESKSSSRIALNRSLIAISAGVFFLTINLREELLFQKILLVQLVFSIPLFLTSILAYSKIGYREKVAKWNVLGWVSFIFGYTFLLNVIGILIGNIISVKIAVLFFLFSWLLTIIYSLVDVIDNRTAIKERLAKDSLFILIQIFLGLLVVLGIF